MTDPVFKWGLSGKRYTDPAEYDAAALLGPATTIVVLPTDGSTFDPPKRIIGDRAGTATVRDCAGNTVTGFPITGGEQGLAVTALSALATTTKVFGLY